MFKEKIRAFKVFFKKWEVKSRKWNQKLDRNMVESWKECKETWKNRADLCEVTEKDLQLYRKIALVLKIMLGALLLIGLVIWGMSIAILYIICGVIIGLALYSFGE